MLATRGTRGVANLRPTPATTHSDQRKLFCRELINGLRNHQRLYALLEGNKSRLPLHYAEEGLFPLHEAAQMRLVGSAAILVRAGADMNAADEEGWTALRYAVNSMSPECVSLLLRAGARERDWSKTLYGIHWNRPEALKILLEFHTAEVPVNTMYDADSRNDGAVNMLFDAAIHGDAAAVHMLLYMGADPNITNRQGKNVLQYINTTDSPLAVPNPGAMDMVRAVIRMYAPLLKD